MAETCREYEACRYAADGHGGERSCLRLDGDRVVDCGGDGEVIASGTLEHCRAIIASLTTYATLEDARWSGTDGDIEAYHESDEEGCGGWAIRPVSA